MHSLTEEDRSDIQGLLMRGFGNLPCARFCLFVIKDRINARSYLHKCCEHMLTTGSQQPQDHAINLAFTVQGLEALGLPHKLLAQWSDPFKAGMVTEHKSRILSDHAESSPDTWVWGGPNTTPIHVLFLVYSVTEDKLNSLVSTVVSESEDSGLSLVSERSTKTLPNQKEHFGFRDGLSQPYIRAFDRHGNNQGDSQVALGEFVLGYNNGYDRLTRRPLIRPLEHAAANLPNDLAGSGMKDLGRNGSYLVFRELKQNVTLFWETMLEHCTVIDTDLLHGETEAEHQRVAAITLASKMVGRWPNGVPLVKAKTLREAIAYLNQPNNSLNDFNYHQEDVAGHRCPLGAHIRRAQPRDMLEPKPGSQGAIDFSNRHRLLRRGRPYGEPFNPELDIDAFLQSLQKGEPLPNAEKDIGLQFMCLGANIQRQFEFVQYSWCTNPSFNGLNDDPDPIMGGRNPHGIAQNQFTLQRSLINRNIQGLPNFVNTRGGAYFFMPGRRAIDYMLNIPI